MIAKLWDSIRLIFEFVPEVQRLRKTVERLEAAELKRIQRDEEHSAKMRELSKDFANLEKFEKSEREKFFLRLENELLKFERRLPPKSD